MPKKDLKNYSWIKNSIFFFSFNSIYLSLGLHKGRPSYRRRPPVLKREHPSLKNIKFLNFFLFLWAIFALLDPDPLTWLNPDPKHWLWRLGRLPIYPPIFHPCLHDWHKSISGCRRASGPEVGRQSRGPGEEAGAVPQPHLSSSGILQVRYTRSHSKHGWMSVFRIRKIRYFCWSFRIRNFSS